jgi:predicted site-specific integrase-resolvase
MPVVINDQTYYRAADVCRMVGISRNTLFRWLKEGVVSDVEYRNSRDWSLFIRPQAQAIRTKTNHVFATSWSD